MTVAHKDLTGSDLHEVKGASTATSGQVPIANGAGGAPFGKLTHSSLQTTGNPFGAQLLHIREEQLNGVASSTSSAAGWVTSALNTVRTNEITSASLSLNTISLPAGTYHFDALVTSNKIINSTTVLLQARLYNITSAAVILYGPSTRLYLPSTTGSHQITAHVRGRFTIGGTSAIRLEQQTWDGTGTGGRGDAAGLGSEVYAEIMIWKVA